MSNKSTTVTTKSKDQEVQLSHHTTDSPILPIAQIERLHKIRPDLVDFVFEQTKLEAAERRLRDKQINRYIFTERILGQVFALCIGLCGLGVAAFLAYNGKDIVAAILGGGTLASLMAVFMRSRNDNK